MKDQPEQTLSWQLSNVGILEDPSGASSDMAKDDMLLKLLDELIKSWLETWTPDEIGSDVAKITLLQDARASISEGQPSELVRHVYQEVFLSDLWGGETKSTI